VSEKLTSEQNEVNVMSNRLVLRWTTLLAFAVLPMLAAPADEFRISGPYVHENLSIFLIHAKSGRASGNFLTLQEAMEKKKAAVYETGSVNELSIENVSYEDVYIQSGDIVKGGRQDRVLTRDFILPAHSGKVPISSFCVERGRWSKRGSESAAQFSASNMMVAARSLKMAVREQKSQTEVWNQVDTAQRRLETATSVGSGSGGGVGSVSAMAAPRVASPSASMQLALESKPVVDATTAYVKGLSKIIAGKNDVSGYVYAINGKLNSAELYASGDLFQRMWPKLLQASATEAVAESKAKRVKPPALSSVQELLTAADGGQESSSSFGRVLLLKKDAAEVILFESRDQSAQGTWVHKSYVAK
jgi:hypothetical protein